MESDPGVFSKDKVTLIRDDFLTTPYISPDSVDLIVTSPPYNLGVNYGVVRDSLPYNEYLEFTRRWLLRSLDTLRSGGRLCINIPLDESGGRSVGADITVLAKQVGFRYHTTIVWNEGTISRRLAWGSWMSATAPFVIAPVELIVVLYKGRWSRAGSGGVSDITRSEFISWTNGLWTFGGESKRRVGHPTPFPLELPRRCIKLFSFVGDTVLDPFCGSGTTLVAAMVSNRVGIGVEIDPQYYRLAVQRVMGIYENE